MRVLELSGNIGKGASSCSVESWQLTLLGHFLCSFHLQLPALVIGHRRSQLLIVLTIADPLIFFSNVGTSVVGVSY